jgi:hypothetical protein
VLGRCRHPRGRAPWPAALGLLACQSEPPIEDAAPRCQSAQICELAEVARIVADRDQPVALVAALAEVCEGNLSAPVEGALRQVASGDLSATTLEALPTSVDEVADLSGCRLEDRLEIATAFGRARRDVGHWIRAGLEVPAMAGGLPAVDRDVEIVRPYQDHPTYEGRPFPSVGTAVASMFLDLQGRVVVVADEDVSWEEVVGVFEIAAGYGAKRFGILVATGSTYGVLPMEAPSKGARAELVVRVEQDGFSLSPPPALPQPGEWLPVLEPAVALDDFERWDFDGLDAELARRTAEFRDKTGRRPDAVVMFEPSVALKVVVATVERVRGGGCRDGDREACRVGELGWVPRYPGM